MKTNVLVFIFVFSLISHIEAQNKKTEDVIYLNNGWVLRGNIIEDNGTQIKIQTQDGNIFVFKWGDITKLAKEQRWQYGNIKKKGYVNFTELGPLVAGKTTIDGVTTAAFSFQTINSYKFSQFAQPGLGIGADLYATQTIIPIFASFRGDLANVGTVIPFYFGDFGYGWNITQNSATASDFKGGLLYAAGVGLKIPFNRSAGFFVSFGYRYQKTSYSNNNLSRDVIYNRLAIRAGFFL